MFGKKQKEKGKKGGNKYTKKQNERKKRAVEK